MTTSNLGEFGGLHRAPIAVLDSGLGGLTVVKALRAAMPQEDILYFGDTARVPYGAKSGPVVTGFVRQIITHLLPFEPKHIVIACNTATALSLTAMKREFPHVPISGVIEPGAKAASVAAGTKQFPVIGVIGTETTIRSKAYELAVARRRNHARMFCRATPLLVPMIEEGRTSDDPLVALAVQQYLTPLLDRGLDVLVLGCTHYPILREAFNRVVGPRVRVIDSAEQCAEDVAHRLRTTGLSRDGMRLSPPAADGWRPGESPVSDPAVGGRLHCFVTDESPRFQTLAIRFLGFPIATPTWVSPEELYPLGPDRADTIHRAIGRAG